MFLIPSLLLICSTSNSKAASRALPSKLENRAGPLLSPGISVNDSHLLTSFKHTSYEVFLVSEVRALKLVEEAVIVFPIFHQ